MNPPPGSIDGGASFPTTRRSVVARLGGEDAAARELAFSNIVESYWKPLYKYLRIRWRLGAEDARDLVQTFFTSALERDFLITYDPAKARFRTFLRVCADRLAANALEYKNRAKRGGGAHAISLNYDSAEEEIAAAGEVDPEQSFDREWTRHLLECALTRLRVSCDARSRASRYLLFHDYYISPGSAAPTYATLAEKYQIKITDVTNELAAARREFRESVLQILREITSSDEEFRDEARLVLGEGNG